MPARRRMVSAAAVLLVLVATVSIAAVLVVALRIVWVLSTVADDAVAVAPLAPAPLAAGPSAGVPAGPDAAAAAPGGTGGAVPPASSATVPAAPAVIAPPSWMLPPTIGPSVLASAPDPSVTQLSALASSYIGDQALGGLYASPETGAPAFLVILTKPRSTDPAVALQQTTTGAQVVLGGQPLAFAAADAGPGGGVLTCAPTQTAQGPAAVCVWSATGIVGMTLVYGADATVGAESARVIRAAVPQG